MSGEEEVEPMENERKAYGTDLLPQRPMKLFRIRKRNTLRRHTFSQDLMKCAAGDRADDQKLWKKMHYGANVSAVSLRRRRVVAAELQKQSLFFDDSSSSRRTCQNSRFLRVKGSTIVELLERHGEEVFFDNQLQDFWDGTWEPRRRYLVRCMCFRPHRYGRFARNENKARFFETDSLDSVGIRLSREQRRDTSGPINYIEPAKINLEYFKTVVAESKLELDDFINFYACTVIPLLDSHRAHSRFFCRVNGFFGIPGDKERLKRMRDSQKQKKKEDLHAQLQGYNV